MTDKFKEIDDIVYKGIEQLFCQVQAEYKLESPSISTAQMETMADLKIILIAELKAWALHNSQMDDRQYTVWIGGTEINDFLLTWEMATKIAEVYIDAGYDNVELKLYEECQHTNEFRFNSDYRECCDCGIHLEYTYDERKEMQELIDKGELL